MISLDKPKLISGLIGQAYDDLIRQAHSDLIGQAHDDLIRLQWHHTVFFRQFQTDIP